MADRTDGYSSTSSSSDEEDDWEELKQLDESDEEFLSVACAAQNQSSGRRKRKWRYKRIDWHQHVAELRHTGKFKNCYHMSIDSFYKLVGILRESIEVDVKQSLRSTSGVNPIIPEMTVGMGLRFLGGEYVKSIAHIFHLSLRSCKRHIDMFLETVQTTEPLSTIINLPTSSQELRKVADEWNAISGAGGIYKGVIGAIDGWLCCIEAPKENPGIYYSGHYCRHGLNVQAVCDSNLRFLYFGVVAPGKSNDLRALGRCEKLNMWMEQLPTEYCLVGDNAYVLTNKMLVPFAGQLRDQEHYRTYNFYLSQLRIRIEMAFGRLTTKWRIFRRNLNFGRSKNTQICMVAAILHNFVIENDENIFGERAKALEDFGVDAWVGANENDIEGSNNGFLPTHNPPDKDQGPIDSTKRDKILQMIIEDDIRRPMDNILRNN